MGLRVERVGAAIILHLGAGEWYNKRPWGMCEDVELPDASWYMDVDNALHSHEPLPAIVVIDATEIKYLLMQDYGFLAELARRLHPEGINLSVIARPNSIAAYAIIPEYWFEPLNMVATLDEAMSNIKRWDDLSDYLLMGFAKGDFPNITPEPQWRKDLWYKIKNEFEKRFIERQEFRNVIPDIFLNGLKKTQIFSPEFYNELKVEIKNRGWIFLVKITLRKLRPDINSLFLDVWKCPKCNQWNPSSKCNQWNPKGKEYCYPCSEKEGKTSSSDA